MTSASVASAPDGLRRDWLSVCSASLSKMSIEETGVAPATNRPVGGGRIARHDAGQVVAVCSAGMKSNRAPL